MNRLINVSLIYDFEGWVLHDIALQLRDRINSGSDQLKLEIHRLPAGLSDLRRILSRCEVIHFLSQYNFYRFSGVVNVASVVTVHHLASEVSFKIFKEVCQKTDTLCSCSEQWVNRLSPGAHASGTRLFFTPYGLDCNLFKPPASARTEVWASLGFRPDAIVLGVSAKRNSNEVDRKGFDRLWEVMEILTSEFGDRIKLIILGPSGDEPGGWSLDHIPLPFRKDVRLPGFLPKSDIPRYLGSLDYYLCLSRVEGGPYPVLESMACQTKVITTEVGVVPNLVQDGINGFLVNSEDYARRIPEIIRKCQADRDYAEKVARQARLSVIEHHSWSKVASPPLYEAVYQQALTRWNKRRWDYKAWNSVRLIMLSLKEGMLSKAPQ